MRDVVPPQQNQNIPGSSVPPQPQPQTPPPAPAPQPMQADAQQGGPESRSIRNIPVPANRRHFIPLSEEYMPENTNGGKKGASFWMWSIGFLLLCVIGGLFVANFFAGAKVTVTPRQASITLPSSVAAQSDASAPVGTLSFQTAALAQTTTRTIASSGTTQVNTAAQGSITIYNAYSTASQTLVANTRFQTPDGKIYRIHQSVTVPGAKKNADKTLSPSTITAVAYADQPGPNYNIGPSRLSIPGFQKDPARYSKFYALTQGMSGGASGVQPSVSQSDLQNAENDMKQELTNKLSQALGSQVPTGFTMVHNALDVAYSDVSITSAGDTKATVTLSATGTEPIVRIADLATALAKDQVQGYGGEAVTFDKPDTVTLTLADGTQYSASTDSITMTESGTQTIVWQYDSSAIAAALAGKSKSQFNQIIATFSPAVAKATASIHPFWEFSFPKDASKISVVTGN
ncbi:MAG TPA: hypothetical protein VF803_01565 [Candidatus Paceibacterota bacterium]